MIPITILTGFLGSGKTTILNQIIEQNPQIKFGLIINEFGQIGIDGQLVASNTEEIVELSNGCMCCVVRKDLQDSVRQLVAQNVDYILIETSGLAEPRPIAETFAMDNLEGQIRLDGIVCILDAANYQLTSQNYQIALEQLQFCDIVLINKTQLVDEKILIDLETLIQKINPQASIIFNQNNLSSRLLIETGAWSVEKLAGDDDSHEHEHHHEHEEFDEVVFSTKELLDPNRLDDWMLNKLPKEVVRAKGILQLKMPQGANFFVFQMVGAFRNLEIFDKKGADLTFSRLVLIGKNLNKKAILEDLKTCTI